jgi:acyl carrier protein
MDEKLINIIAAHTHASLADIHPKTKFKDLDLDEIQLPELCEDLSLTYGVYIDDTVVAQWKKLGHIRDFIQANSK